MALYEDSIHNLYKDSRVPTVGYFSVTRDAGRSGTDLRERTARRLTSDSPESPESKWQTNQQAIIISDDDSDEEPRGQMRPWGWGTQGRAADRISSGAALQKMRDG